MLPDALLDHLINVGHCRVIDQSPLHWKVMNPNPGRTTTIKRTGFLSPDIVALYCKNLHVRNPLNP
jgi:hypothetical protein